MTTVNAGTTATLALKPGQYALATGNGTAQAAIMVGRTPPRLHVLSSASASTLGPAGVNGATFTIVADANGNGITYTVKSTQDGVAILSAAQSVAGAVSAAVNSSTGAPSDPVFGTNLSVPSQNDLKFLGLHIMSPAGGDSSANGARGTARRVSTATRNVNRVAQVMLGGPRVASAQTGEPFMGADRMCRASIEPSLGTSPIRLTSAGRTSMPVRVDAGVVVTDPAVCPIPKGQQFRARSFSYMPKPPTGTLTANATGGTLATGTVYVKAAGVSFEAESYLGAEANIAVTGPTGSVTVSATGLDLELTHVDLYVGSAANAETLLGRFPVVGGVLSATITSLPPSYRTETGNAATSSRHPFAAATMLNTGDGQNLIPYAGTGADETGNAAGTFVIAGPSATNGPSNIVVADGFAGSGDRALYVLSHSIGAGLGTATSAAPAGGKFTMGAGGYVARALLERSSPLSACVYGIASAQLQHMLNGSSAALNRLSLIQYASELHLDFFTNDLGAGAQTWTQIATNVLKLASLLPPGILLERYTVLPTPTSTDYCMTVGSQTVGGNEANRVLLNRWMRAGCPIDASGSPVQSGSLYHPNIDRSRIYDISLAVEVDVNGNSNGEGGFWPAATKNLVAGSTFTVSAATGLVSGATGTLSVATATWGSPTVNSGGQVTKVVKMLTGAQAGALAVVQTNTGNQLTLFPADLTGYTGVTPTISNKFNAAPAAGDTFELWDTLCADGTHPTIAGQGVLANYWNTVA